MEKVGWHFCTHLQKKKYLYKRNESESRTPSLRLSVFLSLCLCLFLSFFLTLVFSDGIFILNLIYFWQQLWLMCLSPMHTRVWIANAAIVAAVVAAVCVLRRKAEAVVSKQQYHPTPFNAHSHNVHHYHHRYKKNHKKNV